MLTMTRTEAIPLEAMRLGMNWDWETIPEYLDSLDATPKGVNCLQYMPVAPLMIYVMGLEAAKSRPATARERKEMQHLLHEGMDAGLCGFSIQRLGEHSVQADFDGTPMVTDTMADKDILALCEVLAERDEGFIQVTQATGNIKADRAFVEKMAKVAKRPVLHNLVVAGRGPEDPHPQPEVARANQREKGLRIFGQGATLRSGFAFTLADWNLYDASQAWNEATTGTKEEKLRKLADPEIRERLKAEIEEAEERLARANAIAGPIPNLIVQGVNRQANLQSYVGKSVGQIAEEEGKHDHRRHARPFGRRRPQRGVPRPRARGSNPDQYRRADDPEPVHLPRRFGRRRPHQVLQWRLLHHRLSAVAGAGREEDQPGGGPLPPQRPARPCGRLP